MIAGISGLLGLVGLGVQLFGQNKQMEAAKDAAKQQRAQRQLEAARARREQIRRAQVASANNLSNATAQGVGMSDALGGGQAQNTQHLGLGMNAINQDLGIGDNIYKANKKAAFGQSIELAGGGISALGNVFAQNSGFITQLGYA